MPSDPNYFNQLMQARQAQAQLLQQREYMKLMQQQQQQADKLNREYQQKLDQTNQQNQSRYLDILQGRTDTRNRIMEGLQNWGYSQVADAKDRYKSLDSQMLADVYSRGFGGSPSMLNSANRSAKDSYDRDLRRINDDMINRRTSADASLSDSLYGFMERKNEMPPDLNSLIALQQGLGRTGPVLGQAGNYGGPQTSGGGTVPGGYIPPAWNRSTAPIYGLPRNDTPVNAIPLGAGTQYRPNSTPAAGVRPMIAGSSAYAGASVPSLASFMPHPQSTPAPNSLGYYAHAGAVPGGVQQLPWQGNNFLGAMSSQPFTTNGNGGMQPLYQSMPALGIFGAGLQKFGYQTAPEWSDNGDGGGGGGYQRVPLWMRDPGFANRLVKNNTYGSVMSNSPFVSDFGRRVSNFWGWPTPPVPPVKK